MLNSFLRKLHVGLAVQLAERLRRREAIIASATSVSPTAPAAPILRPFPLPLERQLLPSDLRRLELQRRSALADCQRSPLPSLDSSGPQNTSTVNTVSRAPPSGEPRRRWLRARLEQVLQEDTILCPEPEAVAALVFFGLV